MNISSIKINSNVVVAPMAGVTDYPYRKILRKMGAELLYTEMISARGIVHGNKKTEELINIDHDGTTGVQIFGANQKIMTKAAVLIEEKYNPDLIDLNLGCPAPKIVKNDYGSALMKKPELTFKIVSSIVDAVNVPVTVKMRKGWDEDNINAVKIAKLCEKGGAAAVTVHGRTREEFYKGKADWNIVRDVKKKTGIPVIGNGNIFTPQAAHEMIEKTNCDAVMLARGIQGNPWLVKRTINYLDKDNFIDKPGYKEKLKMVINHLKKAVSYYGENRAIPLMRKHIAWYLKGMPYSTDVKDRINRSKEYVEVKNIIEEYYNFIESLSIK